MAKNIESRMERIPNHIRVKFQADCQRFVRSKGKEITLNQIEVRYSSCGLYNPKVGENLMKEAGLYARSAEKTKIIPAIAEEAKPEPEIKQEVKPQPKPDIKPEPETADYQENRFFADSRLLFNPSDDKLMRYCESGKLLEMDINAFRNRYPQRKDLYAKYDSDINDGLAKLLKRIEEQKKQMEGRK